MIFHAENVKVVLTRVNNGDSLVTEGEEMRRVRYQGTPMAIYRHILMSEIKDATAALPPVSIIFICHQYQYASLVVSLTFSPWSLKIATIFQVV